MIPAEQAEALILQQIQPLDTSTDTESLDLRAAHGRILATSIVSPLDFPHWDNSAMDGYAVRHADVTRATTDDPTMLTVVEEIPAGVTPQRSLQPGQAARIFTGAMLPPGADTIVIQEVTKQEGDRVWIYESPKPNTFVRHRASFHKAGDRLLDAGTILNAPQIAVLAAAQCPHVSVYRRVRVAILSTGDELVTPDQPLQPGQIVDSNQYALAALVEQMGGEAICLGIVRDDPTALKEAIAHAVSVSDVVLSSGGVSVGDYDYVDQILSELNGTLHIRAVAIKPGKPLTVATFSGNTRPILYFGLPGNPVSALVSFWRFVQPALKKLSGQAEPWTPVIVKGRSRQDLKSDGKREAYLWGQLYLTNGEFEFALVGGGHSSGNLVNLAQANALAIIPIGETLIPTGSWVRILQVSTPF